LRWGGVFATPILFMRPKRYPRDKAKKILDRLKKDIPNFRVTKTRSGDAIFVTLPREKVKVPVHSGYAKNSVQLETIINLSQKMATAMVRETIDTVVDSIISKVSTSIVKELENKLPQQQVIIQQTAAEVAEKTKESFNPDDVDLYMPVDYQGKLEMVGEAGTDHERKSDDMDAILDQLSGLDSVKKK